MAGPGHESDSPVLVNDSKRKSDVELPSPGACAAGIPAHRERLEPATVRTAPTEVGSISNPEDG